MLAEQEHSEDGAPEESGGPESEGLSGRENDGASWCFFHSLLCIRRTMDYSTHF